MFGPKSIITAACIAAAITTISLVVTGCRTGGSGGGGNGGGDAGSQATVRVTLPAASSTTAHTSSSGSSSRYLPSSLGDFDCFAVNVVAPDIGQRSACGGMANLGAVLGFVRRGSTIDINVPLGRNRTFQVWGFANSSSCPDVIQLLNLPLGALPAGVTSSGYLIGEVTTDVTSLKMQVTIPLSYTSGVSTVMCGNSPYPHTVFEYQRLVPGVEALSLSDRQATSNGANVCIGYTTTAISPIVTCVVNGVTTACSSAGCNACANCTGVQNVTPVANSVNTFQVIVQDNANGFTETDPPKFTWTVDTAAPTVAVNSISPGGFNAGSTNYSTSSMNPSVLLTFTDGLAGGSLSYQVTAPVAGALRVCSTFNSTNITKGCMVTGLTAGVSNTIAFTATDSAGNTSAATTIPVIVDRTAPAVSILPANGWLMGGDLSSAAGGGVNSITPGETDTVPGELRTANFACGVDGATVSACPANLTFATRGGKHTATIFAQDWAANTKTSTFNVFIDSLLNLPVLGRLFPDTTYNQDESAVTTLISNLPVATGINSPGQMALDTNSGYLYVADTNNNRVLVFSWSPSTKTLTSHAAVAVFGQSSFQSSDSGTTPTTYTPFNAPTGVALGLPGGVNPKKLFVSDAGNHRVLRFDISTGNANKVADVVFGQTNFTNSAFNTNSGTTSAMGGASLSTGLRTPMGLFYNSTLDRLYVADQGNCRIAAFATAGTTATSGNALSFHLAANGQGTGGAWACPLAADNLNLSSPTQVTVDTAADILYVADTGYNRVMVWSPASTATTATVASSQIGQTAFNMSGAGDGTSVAPFLSGPRGVSIFSDAGNTKYVAVSNFTTNKVKFFTTAGVYVSAWNSSSVAGTTRTTLSGPGNTLSDSIGNNLYVADITNNRIGIFSTLIMSNDLGMSDMLGHSLFSGSSVSYRASKANNPNDGNLNAPSYSVADTLNLRLYVSDTLNNRILVYALDPITYKPASPLAVAAIGTPSNLDGSSLLDANIYSTAASTLSSPKGLALDASYRLYVADSGNNRVLRFDTNSLSISQLSGMSASVVLGQSTFAANTTGATMATMNTPTDVAYDTAADRLLVSDTANHRVLIFTSASTVASGATAPSLLGTGAMGTSVTQLSSPRGIWYTQGVAGVVNKGLFVADTGNNRVNYFDFNAGIPVVGASACYGHQGANLAAMCGSAMVNDSGAVLPNASGTRGLNGPQGVSFDTAIQRLYVADTGNARAAVYDFTLAVNQPGLTPWLANANFHVLGAHSQIDSANSAAIAVADPVSLKGPVGIFRLTPPSGTNLLYIVDPSWHRVGVYEVP